MHRDSNHSGADPPFHFDELVKVCMGDVAFAESLVELFQHDSEQHLNKLCQFASQGDLRSASAVAHALEGSAAVVSASAVRSVAAKIKHAGEQGHVDEVRWLVDALGEEIRACRRYLPAIRELACTLETVSNIESHRTTDTFTLQKHVK